MHRFHHKPVTLLRGLAIKQPCVADQLLAQSLENAVTPKVEQLS